MNKEGCDNWQSARLEVECGVKATEGSSPSPSATFGYEKAKETHYCRRNYKYRTIYCISAQAS